MRHFTIFGTGSWLFHRYLIVIFKDESLRDLAIRFISKLWMAQNSKRGAVPLSSKTLRKEFGPALPNVAKKLEIAGYLEVKPYKVGRYCKQYRLTELMTRFKFEVVGEHEKEDCLSERELAKSQLPPNYRMILENSERTRFDAAGAKQFLKENKFKSPAALSWRENFITLIERKDWPPFKPDEYGRFHYFWTTTPKDLRPFFTSPRGERLLHIDVASCQVCLHSSLYPVASTEKPRFIEVCQAGTFWALMNDQLGNRFDLNDPESKRALKDMVFQDILYAWATYNSDFTDAFKRLFPELAGLIIKARRDRSSKQLPHISTEMQALESEIIIKTAIKSVLESSKNAYVCSLHDCVICTDDLKDKVREALKSAFLHQVGFVPMLKEELL
jgi:hypothetical protein